MFRFYTKILNKLITENLLVIVTSIVILINIVFRVNQSIFNDTDNIINSFLQRKIIPVNLFTYCDVYLLFMFIILIYFILGTDFTNSMEDIALASGGSKINKFMYKKLITILSIYFVLYVITFINIYTIYIKILPKDMEMISLWEIIFNSFTTNIFIIVLGLVILYITRNIPISIVIIASYYLIEEGLWRCKVTQTSGILGHIYQYYDYENGQLLKVKLIYILITIILMYVLYKLSSRRRKNLISLKMLKK